MCSFCVLHYTREILEAETSLGEGSFKGLEDVIDKERLSKAGGERMVRGIVLLIWTEINNVNYSMRHFKEKNTLSMSLLLSVAIVLVRGRVAV